MKKSTNYRVSSLSTTLTSVATVISPSGFGIPMVFGAVFGLR